MDLQANDDICEMFDGRRFGQRLNLNVEFVGLRLEVAPRYILDTALTELQGAALLQKL